MCDHNGRDMKGSVGDVRIRNWFNSKSLQQSMDGRRGGGGNDAKLQAAS